LLRKGPAIQQRLLQSNERHAWLPDKQQLTPTLNKVAINYENTDPNIKLTLTVSTIFPVKKTKPFQRMVAQFRKTVFEFAGAEEGVTLSGLA